MGVLAACSWVDGGFEEVELRGEGMGFRFRGWLEGMGWIWFDGGLECYLL